MRKIEERYYFAYGSNMNLGQMRFRCPDAEVVGNVRLEDYRLAFRGRAPGNGVATVLPEKGSCVDGVLWKITEACEKNLDFSICNTCSFRKIMCSHIFRYTQCHIVSVISRQCDIWCFLDVSIPYCIQLCA